MENVRPVLAGMGLDGAPSGHGVGREERALLMGAP